MARPPLPKQLKPDAIIEAVMEIRFDTEDVPEIFFGRLADSPSWKNFKQQSLPAANIPLPIRRADANLRYQSVFELSEPEGARSVRIGPQTLSYHLTAPYIGWKRFKPELVEAVDQIFAKISDLAIRRIGLRYVNVISTEKHGVTGIPDLNMKLEIDEEDLLGSVNVNFSLDLPSDSACTVRIATKEFIQGSFPADTVAVIDVDVYTKEGYRSTNADVVKEWIEFAHENEKEQFFKLLKPETIEALRED